MKNIQSVISNLRRGSLKKLNSNAIINKLLLTLPKDLRKHILFGSLKGDTLLIAVANKGVCAEINHFKAQDLLNAIDLMQNAFDLGESSKDSCLNSAESSANFGIDSSDFNANLKDDLEILRQIKQIRAYVPKNILEILQNKSLKNDDKIIIQYYKERAKGEFNISKNCQFSEIFSKIKSAIKKNNDESKRAD